VVSDGDESVDEAHRINTDHEEVAVETLSPAPDADGGPQRRAQAMRWPDVVLALGRMAIGAFLAGIVIASVHESRKLKLDTAHADEVRRLVDLRTVD
jgi:hypothetical protein